MSNPNPPPPTGRAPNWLIWLGLLALLAYGVFIERNFSIVAGGSDSSGYLNSAKLFAEGKLQTALRVPVEFGKPDSLNRTHFMPLGFWAFAGDPQLTPTYPTGLPLHFAVAGRLTDWITGPRVVGLFAALGAVLLCYAVGREIGLEARLAAAGAVVLAVCPVFLFTSIQPMSDTLAGTWCLAAVWAGLRARNHRGWAGACGTAFAIAVLVRPTNVVLLPALVILLGWDWRRLALATLGGLPGVAWLAVYNHALYGGALRSGYGDWTATFAWAWGPTTAAHFLRWLALLLPAPLLALPVLATQHPQASVRRLLALAVWFAAIVGVYTFYEVSHETWWCLRFIVPALPALILGGLLGIDALAQRRAGPKRSSFQAIAAAAVAIWAIGLSTYWFRHFELAETKGGERTYLKACEAARVHFPPGTLVATMNFSGALYYYTEFPVLRWDQVDAADFRRYAALAGKAGRTVAALEFRWEEPKALRERCPGEWTRVAEVGNAVLWKLAPAARQAGSR